MTKNRKRLVVVFLAVVVMLLPASSVRATQLLTTTINVPTATFTISKLGALALVINEGVPQSIVVTGRELTGMSVGVNINGKAGLGNVLLSSNLSLLPGTTPLTFDHNGSANFTIAEGMVALTFTGKATTVKDLVMQTRTLSSSGDFVITNATGWV